MKREDKNSCNKLCKDLANINTKYEIIQKKMTLLSGKRDKRIPPGDGKKIVEIANMLAIGETNTTIDSLSKDIVPNEIISRDELNDLSNEARRLLSLLNEWERIINKYLQAICNMI